MRLPGWWLVVVVSIGVGLAALGGNVVVDGMESPAAGLHAENGRALDPPPQIEGFESTPRFDVATRVTANGDARVRETIVHNFGESPRHGIERIIPLRDSNGAHRISDLVISTSRGTPDDVDITNSPNKVTIRIGDPDTLITGTHTYELDYRLTNMTTAEPGDQIQLRIDAISAWRFQITDLRYTVTSPDTPSRVRCDQGVEGARAPCASAELTDTGGEFVGTDLFADQALTVEIVWPTGAIAAGNDEPWLSGSNIVYALAAAAAVALVAWWQLRRWRRLIAAARSEVWSTFGPDVAGRQVESFDLLDDPAIEFVPPMKLRPGEMGALLEVDGVQLLTATMIDLAARGALTVTETDTSWTIARRNRELLLSDDERLVIGAVFGDADHVEFDPERRTTMGSVAARLAEDLTDELEERGLAERGTNAAELRTRIRPWRALWLGLVAVAAGCGAHYLVVTVIGDRSLAAVVELAVALGIITLGGAIIVAGAGRGATPKGLAASWRVRGFKRFFTESEAMHARAAADAGLLRQYMGYAVVFGHVQEWIDAFDAPDTSDWFVHRGLLGTAFVGFTASSNWTPASSTSGFSSGFSGAGGGSGGGGGGSW